MKLPPFRIVIPARLASERLPRKVLLPVAGVPLLGRVIAQAQQAGAAEIVVASDSSLVLDYAQTFAVTTILTGNHPSGTSRLAEVVTHLRWPEDTLVVNWQGDEPLLPIAVVQGLVADLEASSADLITAACPLACVEDYFSANVVKVVWNQRQEALYFSRSPLPAGRDGAIPWEMARRHLGVYAYRAHFLQTYATLAPSPWEESEKLEQLRALYHGFRIALRFEAAPLPRGMDSAEDHAWLNAYFAQANT
jgi:3-deoxy-manno-octulosonate cytidylyltransferase (CMP-KDO synthetase)